MDTELDKINARIAELEAYMDTHSPDDMSDAAAERIMVVMADLCNRRDELEAEQEN